MPASKATTSRAAATVYPDAPEMRDLRGKRITEGCEVVFSQSYGQVHRLSVGSVSKVGLNIYKKAPNRMGVAISSKGGKTTYRDCKDVCVVVPA